MARYDCVYVWDPSDTIPYGVQHGVDVLHLRKRGGLTVRLQLKYFRTVDAMCWTYYRPDAIELICTMFDDPLAGRVFGLHPSREWVRDGDEEVVAETVLELALAGPAPVGDAKSQKGKGVRYDVYKKAYGAGMLRASSKADMEKFAARLYASALPAVGIRRPFVEVPASA
jgi:hypothetical protein